MGDTSAKQEVKLIAEIGRGTYAIVYRAVWMNRHVAAKKFHPFILGKPEALKYTDDWKLLRELNHPNIVKYLTVVLPGKSPKSNESIIIVTELLDQDLKKFIETYYTSKRKVSFRDTVSIMLDVAEGLNYLHEAPRSIAHRDLACKNILLTANKQAKIADFGFAKYFPGGEMAATANPGTLATRAPETFGKALCWSREKISYSTQADVFSFGVVMLEVIVGHPSMRISELRTEDGKIVPECIRRSEDLHEINVEHPLRHLVLCCLEDNPEDRPTALGLVNELSEHKNNNDFQRSQDNLHSKQIIHRMPAENYDYKFKVVLVGDTGVGKTSIATKFVQPSLSIHDRRPPTMIYGEFSERLQLKGKSVLLQIVDTSGQYNTTSSIPQFYRGAHGAVVVFDVACWDSLVSVRQWVSMVRDKCSHDNPIILVGNKTDCEHREVSAETAEHVRDEFNLFYIEVSAKTGVNIDETFSVLTEQLMQQRDLQSTGAASSVAVCHQPSTSSQNNGPPAKFTVKEPSREKRIKNDPDSISLKPGDDNVGGVDGANYGSTNSSTADNRETKKKWCCF